MVNIEEYLRQNKPCHFVVALERPLLRGTHCIGSGRGLPVPHNRRVLASARDGHDVFILDFGDFELLLSLLVVLALVALGVLGRADLASLGVDACAALSFALDYFAGGFWWHVCIYLT